MAEAGQSPETEALWRFSLDVYGLPGVAQALIALQDREGIDVNLVLFALWLGVSGRARLEKDELRAADRAICAIRIDVVEPLRALRRSLRQNPDPDIQCLRQGVKALELAAEKLVQTRLARIAGSPGGEISRSARLSAAQANLALYLGSERARGAEAVTIGEALKAFLREY